MDPNELPKILHIRASNFLGSPERLIIGQVQYSKAFRHLPVTYIRRGCPSEFASALARDHLEHYVIREAFPGDLSPIAAIVRVIRKLRPRLVVTHDYKSNLLALIGCSIAGTRHVVYFHGYTAESARIRFYNAIDRRVIRHVDAVITVADASKAYLTRLGVPAERIAVVPNAIPDSSFDAVAPMEIPQWGGAPFIGAVGRLSYEKGFDLLIDAFAASRPAEHLVIFGDGPERGNLQFQASELGLSNKVHFTGYVGDLRPAYAAMQFMVIPSRSEGFPLVLLEAWAQGTPVVSTPVGTMPELICSGHNGFLARDISIASISEVLKKACGTPDFKERCGAEARGIAAAQFRFHTQVPELEALYNKIASNSPM